MATEIRMWQIEKETPVEVRETVFANLRRESDLEGWIVKKPQLLEDDLLIIGHQVSVPGGKLDLLAVEEDGTLVIIELKRGKAPREAVAQALDYASWLNSCSESEIREIAEKYLKKSLDVAFSEHFDDAELTEISPQRHRILIIAATLDDSAERIINYLAQRYEISINAAFFNYAKLPNGTEILARSILLPDAVEKERTRAEKRTLKSIEHIAAKRMVLGIITSFREILSIGSDREYVSEDVSQSFGGSLKYNRKDVNGRARAAFRLKISGNEGELEMRIMPANLAEILELKEGQVRKMLTALPNITSDKKYPSLTVRDENTARQIATKFVQWFSKYPGYYAKS